MSRGGIREGAGRPRRRRRIGDCLCLNAHTIQRVSMWVWYQQTWQTRRYGEVAVEISREPQVMLAVRDGCEDRISLEYTDPLHGGERMWFLCPSCGRRCRDVYLPLDHYLWGCRVCLDLSYATENETRFERLARKEQKLQVRLAKCRPRQSKVRKGLLDQIMRVEMKRERLLAYWRLTL